jgi:nucleotide-binding universal stress UspA family protein
MIARILVALDESPRARGVFTSAAEVAQKFGAKMWLLRVVTLPPEFPPAAHVGHSDGLADYLKANVVSELEAYADGEFGNEIAATLVTFGASPWRQILSEAENVDADLIVVGSHGYDGLDRVLGTTAGAVANRSRRNVLVVHDRTAPPSPISGTIDARNTG